MLLQNLKKLQKKDKIIGIGVDIISKSRIKKSIKKESFIKRIFSKYEINISKKLKIKFLISLRDSLLKKLLLKL